MVPKTKLSFSNLINDQPSLDDGLGFEPYVEALGEFLTHKQTMVPLTVSIEGDWGSGKSSFLRQLDARLNKKTESYHSVWFNPWRYSENEALWAAFAIEFERSLSANIDTHQLWLFRASRIQLKKLLWDLAAIVIPTFIMVLLALIGLFIFDTGQFKPILQSIALLLGFFLPLGPAIKIVSEAKDKISKGLMDFDVKKYLKERPDYTGKIPFLDEFHKDLEILAKHLVGEARIYIFVDDLDRCQHTQAVELMQAINLMISDEMKAIFILAIDRKKIAAGLALKNKEYLQILNRNEELITFGYEYIDKFIQLPFQVPRAKVEDIQKLTIDFVTVATFRDTNEQETRHSTDHAVKVENDSTTTESETTKVEPEITERQRAVHVDYEAAMPHIKAVMAQVSPLLQNNPRKIKKFLNILRFQVQLGNQMALFGMDGMPDNFDYKPITAYQLGRFLACSFIWPDFVLDWAKYPDFLTDLLLLENRLKNGESQDAKGFWAFLKEQNNLTTEELTKYQASLLHWIRTEGLFKFLIDEDAAENGSIFSVPVRRLLEISPVYKTADFIEPSSTHHSAEIVKPTVDSEKSWKKKILWVDDRPENNVFGKKVFEDMGLSVSLSLNTSDALQQLSSQRFAVVISDMGRNEGPREGYVLLDKMRQNGDKTPFVIFASSNSIKHKMETVEHGGQGCTNNINELVEIITGILLGHAK